MQPRWTERLLDVYKAGIAHAFVLHFNVGDYVSADAPVTTASYLAKLFAGRETVAVYSRDRGITFPTDTMRQKAMELWGSDTQKQASNSTLDALGISLPTNNNDDLPRNPAEALPMLDKLLRAPAETAVIIENAEFIVPDSGLAMMNADDRTALAIIARWGRDPALVAVGNPVILLTGNLSAVHSEIRAASNRYEAIEVPLPDAVQRLNFIKRWMDERQVSLADGLTLETVANATAGLSLLHVEDVLLRAETTGTLTYALVWERKQDIIRAEYADVLEIIEPKYGFDDIGGLAHVKDFFRRSVIAPMHSGNKSRVPMGILMTGPAGTGKSIMAVAVAKEAGVNAINLRIGGQIASKWQGEGERNLDKALRAVEGLKPSIVFIDEIDQSVRRGGEGGGNQQENRIFQRLLEFMSDTAHRGDIVFLAATNRPDLLDAALRRPGRFDKKIPFLIPDAGERVAIFAVMARRYLGEALTVDEATVAATEGWTGAEIETAAVKAVELVQDEQLPPEKALYEATQRLSPSTADIELMTMLAVRETNDRDLLPPKYQAMLQNRGELDEKITQAEGLRKGRQL